MPKLSIIIPTHKRADILERCLQHLAAQTVASDIEVIVIHDGQDDKTDRLMAKSSWQIPVYYESIPKSQQGVARNTGVQKAQSSTCLFIGDDIFLKSDACAHHLNAHGKVSTPSAVLGVTEWDPNIEITKVMEWLDESGWQFGYRQIQQYANSFIPPARQHLFSYPSHISVPTEVARRTPFIENITMYGWEDMEWGMRLRDIGVPLYFAHGALAHHHHTMTMEDSLRRMETIGTSAVLLKRDVPDFDRVPTGLKLAAYEVLSLLPTMAGKHQKSFLKGMKNAQKEIRS